MYSFAVFLMLNWALVFAVVAAVIICGAIAWFTKNWKVAAVGLAVLGALFAGQHLFTAGVDAEVARQVAREKALLEHRIQIANEIADSHMKRAEEDAAKIEELERLASQTPANPDACFDIDATGRVRALRKSDAK